MRHRAFSDIALGRPVAVLVLVLATMVLGLIGFGRMPLSYLPREDTPRLSAKLDIDVTSADILEREVVRPFEEQIATIRDVERVQVGSGRWGVRVNIDFEPGTDIDARKMELRDRVDRLRSTWPSLVRNVQIEAVTNLDQPTMELQIASRNDLSNNYALIEERIVRPIESLPGIARVEFGGISPPELEVDVDLETVSAHGVSMQDLATSVREARQGRSLGEVWSSQATLGLRAPTDPPTPESLRALPLRRGSTDTTTEFAALGEVATVTLHPREDRFLLRLNGRPSIYLGIYAQSGASPVDVSRRVRERLERFSSDPMLAGIEVLDFHDQGETILQTLADLRNSGIYGGLLGVVVLALFVHRLAPTLVVAASIPLSIVASGAVLFLRGEELNCVVMLGLVLGVGMLLDNAVVMVEAITRASRSGLPPREAAGQGAREVGFAMLASTASTVVVFIPLMTSDPTDPTSAYLRPLGSTFSIGLIASLLVSQFVLPLLMPPVLARPQRPTHGPVLERVSRAYGWLVTRSLRHPRLTCSLAIACAASSTYSFLHVNYRLGDAERQPDNITVRIELSGDRSLERFSEVTEVLESKVLAERDTLGLRAFSCELADYWGQCSLYPSAPFESEAEFERFGQRLQAVLPEQVGVTYRVGEREFDWRENTDRNAVDFVLKGEDMGELMRLSKHVADHLRARLPKGELRAPDAGGYDHVTTPYDQGADELHVVLDRERLDALAITPSEVARQVRFAYQGESLGSVPGSDGALELRLSSTPSRTDTDGASALRELSITLPSGRAMPLGTLGRVQTSRQPWWVQRVDGQTEVHVVVRFFSSESTENWELVRKAMADVELPAGYTWGPGTRWWREREASHETVINLGLCLLLVYALMASLFESFVQPLGILLVCILSAFGAPWALLLSQTTLDTTAVLGFFILIGVVVNNGIMLVDKTEQLRAEGMPRDDALREAAQQRLRPILMTATTTIVGLIPMLLHHPTLAGMYYHAVAIVIAGGLATSTLMTLIVLPSTYVVLEGMAASARHAWNLVWKNSP